MKKISINDLSSMKKEGEPVAWITAYDFPLAQAAERAGIDMILVGDSGGMVQLGYSSTHPVTMDEMVTMAKAVRRGAPNTFIIGDMPQGSYEVSKNEAVRNALRFIKEAGCDAIKCEGGRRVKKKVKAMVDAGIVVFGHLGLTPQSSETFGGYKVQGKTVESFDGIMHDAIELQDAGISVLLLEAMPSEPAGQIANYFDMPIYGIGAGELVDGQLMIAHDLLGFYSQFRPKFAKCYIPEVIDDFHIYLINMENARKEGRKKREDGLLMLIEKAIFKYIEEVRNKEFPGEEYCYSITEAQLGELGRTSHYWKGGRFGYESS